MQKILADLDALYLNGKLNGISTATADFISSYNTNVFIGKQGDLNRQERDYTPGIIDDICIYNRALTESEIKQLHNGDEIAIAPASCQLYAVHDKGVNDAQFFTVNLENLTVTPLGPLYKNHDIEALAVHPETNMLYAASGDKATDGKPGDFYRVDGQTGQLFPIGSTGFTDIEDLAFSPEGRLYAWAKGDGLITIDLTTGQGTLVLASQETQIEGLTLKKEAGVIFLGAVGTDLWQYNSETKVLEILCSNLLGETEALETTSDGVLLIGTHKVPFGLHTFDIQTCQVIQADKHLSNQFDDVEGIALPIAACAK